MTHRTPVVAGLTLARPKPLPNHWMLGSTIGLSVDADDHVWILHRPETVEDNFKAAAFTPAIGECCVPAPPVLEFDQAGTRRTSPTAANVNTNLEPEQRTRNNEPNMNANREARTQKCERQVRSTNPVNSGRKAA